MKYYYYEKWYPNCYSLHRPDGTNIAFLQGDDARELEKSIETIQNLKIIGAIPNQVCKSVDHGISEVISEYDC